MLKYNQKACQAEWNPVRRRPVLMADMRGHAARGSEGGDRSERDDPEQRERFLRRLENIRRIKSAVLLADRGRTTVRNSDAQTLALEVGFELQLKGRTRWGKTLEEPSLVLSSVVALPGQKLPLVSVFTIHMAESELASSVYPARRNPFDVFVAA